MKQCPVWALRVFDYSNGCTFAAISGARLTL